MSLKNFMVSNNNIVPASNNGNENLDQGIEQSDFDLSQVIYDEETQSFSTKESQDQNNIQNLEPSQNSQPSNNFNIAQLPEFQALQQQNQNLQNQLLQVVQLLRQQPQQQPQQPQFDMNEVMTNPQLFQQYMEYNNKNIVNQLTQVLQPKLQQYDNVVNAQSQQAQLQQLYQQAVNTYPDFEQVIGTDVNKALSYAKQFGSFPAAYEIMKREIAINGNNSKTSQRRQRISRVENGGNVTQDNLSVRNVVHDPYNSARNSALAGLEEVLSKR